MHYAVCAILPNLHQPAYPLPIYYAAKHSTLYSMHYILCTMHDADCSMNTVHTPMYHIQLCTTLCTMPPDTMQYAVNPNPYAHYATIQLCTMKYALCPPCAPTLQRAGLQASPPWSS